MVHPVWGWFFLAGVLWALYLFVGHLGAGVMVDWLESTFFGEWLNPLAEQAAAVIPWPLVRDFLVGEYGLVTMALSYSIAIVLPIVLTFFLAFSLLEDSGYLARLAVMANRPFKAMGLNGKAVLPMVLGLGCDTMATLTTRILETRKERIQVTLLLALGVPCSAQLGVLLGMVAILSGAGVTVWLGVVLLTLFVVGWLAARLLPGQSSDFILELPPIRQPQLKNIVVKTVARVEWYLKEVLPLFIAGTTLLFVLDKVGLLVLLERLIAPLVQGLVGTASGNGQRLFDWLFAPRFWRGGLVWTGAAGVAHGQPNGGEPGGDYAVYSLHCQCVDDCAGTRQTDGAGRGGLCVPLCLFGWRIAESGSGFLGHHILMVMMREAGGLCGKDYPNSIDFYLGIFERIFQVWIGRVNDAAMCFMRL